MIRLRGKPSPTDGMEELTPRTTSYPSQLFSYRGHLIEVSQDQDPPDPREWEEACTMFCWHRRYNLGDYKKCREECSDPLNFFHWFACECDPGTDQLVGYWEAKDNEERAHAAVDRAVSLGEHLPLYLYDHSGITMSTGPFGCPWDCGQVGWICMTPKQIRDTFLVKRITKKVREKARALMVQSVDIYDQFIRGDVYIYHASHPGSGWEDCCGGMYGSDYCIQEARDMVDHHCGEMKDERKSRLRGWVKNRVPLKNRVYPPRMTEVLVDES